MGLTKVVMSECKKFTLVVIVKRHPKFLADSAFCENLLEVCRLDVVSGFDPLGQWPPNLAQKFTYAELWSVFM